MTAHRVALAIVALIQLSCRANEKGKSVVQAGDPSSAPTLKEPYVVSSDRAKKLLDVTIAVKEVTMNVPGLGERPLRAYALLEANGKTVDPPIVGFPGPTLRVRAGDSVRIKLINSLAVEAGHTSHTDSTCANYPASTAGTDKYPNCFHALNTTNLHFHGLHVPVDSTADDPFVQIKPTETHQYAFRIGPTHPAGTFWYHPHNHGSAAVQILNGMSGAFIVEDGPLDRMNAALNIREHLIAVQQIDSQVPLMTTDTTIQPSAIVNAQLTPIIVMRPGEVQRWRIVNENVATATTYSLVFDSAKARPLMVDIARDGIQYAKKNYNPKRIDTTLSIGSGNRLDVYVQAPTTPGRYGLRAVVTGRVPGLRRRALQGAQGAQGATAIPVQYQLVAVQVVDSGTGPYASQLPDSLPTDPSNDNLRKPTTNDTTYLVFTQVNFAPPNAKATPPLAYLGTAKTPLQQFNPNKTFLTLPLDNTQTWVITNTDAAIAHPFHIHVNPYQVLSVTFGPNDANAAFYSSLNAAAADGHPLWMDTFPMPLVWTDSSSGKPVVKNGSIVIRQAYKDFTGYTVLHCHIIGHEERGMMQRIRIARR